MGLSKNRLRVACLQVNAGSDLEKNLASVRRQIQKALRSHPDLIALPENFCWRGPRRDLASIAQEKDRIVRSFQALAKKYRVGLLLGSLIEPSPRSGKYYNTSVLISGSGRIAAEYRKIHLFDLSLKDLKSKESDAILAGKKIVTAHVEGVTVGLSICYDLRFPELYRTLAAHGSRIIFVPSNFTYPTGKAHWDVLLRARAIENQAFIVAPAQVGRHPATGIRSFGNSRIVDPWGRLLARGGLDRAEIITAELDFKSQDRLQREFPVLQGAG